MKNEDILLTLLESLPILFEYLITALETMLIKKLTIIYVTTRLMHEMWKCKEKKPQHEDVAIVFRQSKGDNSFPYQDAKLCSYYGKPGYLTRFCYKTNK